MGLGRDLSFIFSNQQAITGTADVVSTNVYDAGSAKVIFDLGVAPVMLVIEQTASGGTNPTMRARFVAADNAALTTNPIILCETGVSAVLAAADIPRKNVLQPVQVTAKQFYGVIFLQTGTTPTATVNAFLAGSHQTNLIR